MIISPLFEYKPSICSIIQTLHSMASPSQFSNNFMGLFMNIFSTLAKHFFTPSTASNPPNKSCPYTCMSSKKEMSSKDENAISNINERKHFTSEDGEMVLKKLGLWNPQEEEVFSSDWCDRICRDCEMMGEASLLLEEKVAGEEELREAFSVFDKNGDGYITTMELHRVMKMLGFREGMKFGSCKLMVEAFDEDGDGRICFSEFKRMMEGTT